MGGPHVRPDRCKCGLLRYTPSFRLAVELSPLATSANGQRDGLFLQRRRGWTSASMADLPGPAGHYVDQKVAAVECASSSSDMGGYSIGKRPPSKFPLRFGFAHGSAAASGPPCRMASAWATHTSTWSLTTRYVIVGGLGQLPVGRAPAGLPAVLRRGIAPRLQSRRRELCQGLGGARKTSTASGQLLPEPETRHWAPHPAARCRPGSSSPAHGALLGCRNSLRWHSCVILQQSSVRQSSPRTEPV